MNDRLKKDEKVSISERLKRLKKIRLRPSHKKKNESIWGEKRTGLLLRRTWFYINVGQEQHPSHAGLEPV